MSTLEDQLHGLADAPADPATPPEPDQLWRRGRRWQLRRRVGTWVGAVLVLGVVGALAWPGLQSAPLQAAAGAEEVGLPKVAWVNTSEHLGELERGPVVAVASGTRRGWGAHGAPRHLGHHGRVRLPARRPAGRPGQLRALALT